MKYIVDNKGNVNQLNYNLTPLHRACRKRNTSYEVIKLLLENKSKIEYKEDEFSPVHSLTQHSSFNTEILKLLFEYKFDFNLKTNYSKKPLYSYCSLQDIDLDIVKFFCESINVVVDEPIETYNTEVFNYFLENNIPVEKTFFFCHFLKKNLIDIPFLKYLIEKKFDLNSRSNQYYTPFDIACSNSNISLEVLKLLLENKANPNITKEETTPFLKLCQYQSSSPDGLQMIHLLAENKADLNARDYDGEGFFSYFRPSQNVLSFKESIIFYLLIGFEYNVLLKIYPQNEFVSSLSHDISSGCLWNIKRNKYFPGYLRKKNFLLVFALKKFSKDSKIIFPKPLIHLIISKYINSYFNK